MKRHLAKDLVTQVTSQKTNWKKLETEILGLFASEQYPLTVRGRRLTGNEKDTFLKALKSELEMEWSKRRHNIQTLFWLYYTADMVQVHLRAQNREQKISEHIYKLYADSMTDISEIISLLKLI